MVMGNELDFFNNSRGYTTVGPRPIQVEKADFDRDSRLDVAILSVGTSGAALQYAQRLYVLRGNGAGGFDPSFEIALEQVTDASSRFAVGDFNSDGWPDLALLEPAAARVRLALNTRDAEGALFDASTEPLATGERASAIAAGDLDGDDTDDLVLGYPGTEPRVGLLVSDGAGGVASNASVAIGCSPTCMAVAPIDGDDALDIALGGSAAAGGASAHVILGDGDGGIAGALSADLSGVPSDLAVGDLDRAGGQDLALVQPASAILSSVLVLEVADGPRFVRGDANSDGATDVSDAVFALRHLFGGGPGLPCQKSADADSSGDLDLTDAVFLLDFLFLGADPPPHPFPNCGADPGEDGLTCELYWPCTE
jgi:hypothetical protein